MARLFGTDGVRGIANVELTASLAYRLGRAGAYVLTRETNRLPKILIGMDTRISGDMLEAALVAGICSVGAEAICIGVLPTPGIAYLVKKYGCDCGVVISASHNPMEDNGIKFFNAQGYKLRDELEDEIESFIYKRADEVPSPIGAGVGKKSIIDTAVYDYIDYLKGTVNADFKGLKVALDCANGSAYKAAPVVFSQLGAEIFVIHNEPDGENINKNCGSTHLDDLRAYVKTVNADVGIAFDGDADRLMIVDETGNVVDGDGIIAMLSLYLKEKQELPENGVVVTVMSNLGFSIMAKQNGLNAEYTDVGDRYVLERMQEKGYMIGGEQSGHIIMLNKSTTGDGILVALQTVAMLKEKNKNMSELASIITVYPQVMVNAKVQNEKKYKYMENEEIAKAIEILTQKFSGEGRVLIRPSGTQAMVRVMIEGKDESLLKTEAEKLAKLIEEKLG